ncbi:hypothetical protein Syun_025488 [Stephania yunnanensis]|uniref:Protein phosphatase 1 regulatory subunit 11 n=1 Tax=Stephania yunnanensis TaxID=152371 RepID=A0AAP0HRB1_9MAGN
MYVFQSISKGHEQQPVSNMDIKVGDYTKIENINQTNMASSVNTRSVGSSTTTTITLENPSQQHQQPQALVLRLSRQPSAKKKKVSWKEGTVDNEFLQRKSSKKCCIFHKQKPFDEDDSDDDDDQCLNHESSKSNKNASHGNCSGSCSKDSEASTSSSHSGSE